MKYKIIEHDADLYVIKFTNEEFEGLLISLYGVGFTENQLYYHYNILNETEFTNTENLDIIVDEVVNELYLKE